MDDMAMSHDAEVLETVIRDHGLTVAQVATRSGYAEKTIYRYLSNEGRTLPSEVIRAVYELTADNRLILLITGSVPVQFQPLEEKRDCPHSTHGRRSPVRIPPIEDVLPRTLEAAEQVVKCGQLVAKIMADGKLDASDLSAVDKFQACISYARKQLAVCDAAMESARERVTR